MSDHVQKVTQLRQTAQPAAASAIVDETRSEQVGGSDLAARIVWYIAGILLAFLALRFILALLGANPSNGFANFIYSVTHPFVAPFFSLFGYNLHYGVSSFESFTLVAMAVYGLVAFAIAKLVTIGSRSYN